MKPCRKPLCLALKMAPQKNPGQLYGFSLFNEAVYKFCYFQLVKIFVKKILYSYPT